MSQHEARMIEHALDVLRAMVERKGPRMLGPCDKLACRVLASFIGAEALKTFCDAYEQPATPWGGGHLVMRLQAIEAACERYSSSSGRNTDT